MPGWVIAIIIIVGCILAILGLGIAAIKWLRKHITIERIDPAQALTLGWKKEVLWQHVQVIVKYELIDTENPEEAEDILNTMFLPIYNGVILTHKISKRLFIEAVMSTALREQIDVNNMNEDELLRLVPSVYCADADIVHLQLDGLSMYTADFNTELEHFEGDNYCEFFK